MCLDCFKHETTLSNEINNCPLEGLIYISEKKSKVRHNSLLVTNQDPKAGLPLKIVYLLRKLNPLCCLGTLFLDSPDGLIYLIPIKIFFPVNHIMGANLCPILDLFRCIYGR